MFEQYAHPTDQPDSCAPCPMSRQQGGEGQGFCPGRGNIAAPLVYIGEGPGSDEVAWHRCEPCNWEGAGITCPQGHAALPWATAFVGRAGKLSAYMRDKAAIHPTHVYKTNVLKCRPPGNKYPTGKLREEAEAYCTQLYLSKELVAINVAAEQSGRQPVIIAAGAQALRRLTGVEGISDRRGYVYAAGDYPQQNGLPDFLPPVVGTMHPAFMFRSHGKGEDDTPVSLISLTIGDYQKASRIARSQSLRRPPTVHHAGMTLGNALRFLEPAVLREGRLTMDFEWDYQKRRTKVTVAGVGVGDEIYSAPIGSDDDLAPLRDFIRQHPAIKLVAHNGLTADFLVLEEHGVIPRAELLLDQYSDTIVKAHLAYPDALSGMEFWGSVVTDLPYWKDMAEAGDVFTYCGYDVYGADTLDVSLDGEISELGLEASVPVQQRCQLALARIGGRGLRIDHPRIAPARAQLQAEIQSLLAGTPLADLKAVSKDAEGWRSSKQLHELFKQRHGKLPRSGGKETLDKKALTKFAAAGDELAATLLRVRELDTLDTRYLSTYEELTPDDQERYICTTRLDLTKAGTGRIQAAEPNLLQVPRRSEVGNEVVRSLFIPREPGWVLVEADWKQIEAVLVWHFAGCQRMLGAFQRGEDVHARNAAAYGIARDAAKIATHGGHYRAGAKRLSDEFGVPVALIEKALTGYFTENPEIVQWWTQVEQDVVANRGLLRLPFGRIRRFQGQADDWLKEALATMAQGTVADMLIRVVPELEYEMAAHFEGNFLLPVHDSALLECPPSELPKVYELLQDTMARKWPELGNLSVPIDIKVGERWSEVKEWRPAA